MSKNGIQRNIKIIYKLAAIHKLRAILVGESPRSLRMTCPKCSLAEHSFHFRNRYRSGHHRLMNLTPGPGAN